MCTLKISFQYGKVNHKTTMCTQSDHCLHDRTHAIEHATVEQFDDSVIEAMPHFDKRLLKLDDTVDSSVQHALDFAVDRIKVWPVE